jgi:tetratricopeptide (TPR) repeat protein
MRYIVASLLSLALFQAAGKPVAQGRTTQTAASPRERAYRSNNTGVAFLEQFNYQDAERHFRAALKIDPGLAIARLNLGIAVLYAGRPVEALQEARAAAKLLPDIPQAHFVLALAAKGDDKTDEAVPAFERVLKIDPADPATKIHLGQIHLQQRRYPDALKLFQEALAAEPYNVTAAYNVALALTRSGQQEEGRAAMQRFEKLRDSPYGVTFAQTYLSQGRYGEAIASTGAEADLVDAAVPDVRFVLSKSAIQRDAGVGRTVQLTLFDVDGDGDLDLFELGATGHRLLRNQNGVFTDAKIALPLPAEGKWAGAVAGDYDNDGRPDLLVLGASTHRLFHQTAAGAFDDVSEKAGLPRASGDVTSAAFLDADHDGDLDILAAGDGMQLLQNNGDGTFTDITTKAGFANVRGVKVRSVAPTDYDNRRDIDVLTLGDSGPALFRNMRDGTFRAWSAEAGLGSGSGPAGIALAVGDLNKDGYPDVFDGQSFWLSDGQARFKSSPAAKDMLTGGSAHRFVDFDNDGLLDLLSVGPAVTLFRNLGQGRWSRIPAVGLPGLESSKVLISTALAVGDVDGDGDSDVLVGTEYSAQVYTNEGGNRHASLRVRLAARVSNRAGIGSKVEIRAGSLRQMLETSSATPPVAPADLVFGLGPRPSADVVRTLWPSGILQAETELAAAAPKGGRRPPLTITELDRKPSSCPYLFTWNGSRFEFITDFMGGGEMGGWQGPGAWNQPDPDEYVRIRGDQLQARNGRYELRMTNELEEALFVDRLQLLAVDHEEGVEVFPNEGLRSAPRPPFAVTAVRNARPPARAVDEHGHDVLPQIQRLDRRYPDDFRLSRVRGYADTHELVMDLGEVSDRAVLLLTGWTDYAFSSDNVAASQHGAAMSPPSLQVRNQRGEWQTAIEETGVPVGRPQTVVLDLTGKFPTASRQVRIVTNMRIYWDQVLVASSADAAPVSIARLDPSSAALSWRGLSQEITPDGREPFSYDYHRPTPVVPWKAMAGRYTREGDVRTLLTRTDDMFVVSRPGDEVSLTFDALAPVRRGRARTFLLFVHGYSKEMNPRSAVPDTVGPLPFRAMTTYPYGEGEHYPRTKAHREYQDRYNTRFVPAPVPSIDTAVLSSGAPAAHDSPDRNGGRR